MKNYDAILDKVEKEIKHLTGEDLDWSNHYTQLKQMYQSMCGFDENGDPLPDEQWVPRFIEEYGTREAHIEKMRARKKNQRR